jgi:AcrR family transcriptional regulator
MSSENIDTPTRILKSTLTLLEAPGAKLPTMSDIAKAAGVSRQAVYLHYPSRTDVLIAATRHQDQMLNIDAALAPSRNATSGRDRLDAYVTAWCNYVPKIHGVARAVMAVVGTDAEAKAAWDVRMADMREGCAAAVAALARDGVLPKTMDEDKATDLLWALLSIQNWENLTQSCGWDQACYVATMRALALATLAQDTGPLTDALACTPPPA